MKRKYILSLIILIILGVIILLMSTQKENYFDKIDLSNDNVIENSTTMKFMDTITSVGLLELNIKNVYVHILPLSDHMKNKFEKEYELEFNAHIIGEDYRYLIFIRDMCRLDGLNTMSHELIHLKQYYEKRLKILNQDEVFYNGMKHNIKDFNYFNRPWEKEAYDGQDRLKKNIMKKLYKKHN
jgi:hypothetical protein